MVCLVGCIGLGLSLRFANLDLKVYSYDEAITSLRISGHTWQEVVTQMGAQTSDSLFLRVDQFLQRYQSVDPTNGVGATVAGLAQEESQLTPLYFLLVRLWAQWVGDSVAAVRGFSALLSVASLWALYRLSCRLFRDSLTPLMGVAIASVSPFLLLYAQDARPYTLLSLAVILSADALLTAFTRGTVHAWGLYGLSALLGLYSHLLFALVLAGHGLYISLLSLKKRTLQPVGLFAGSMGLAVVAFSPWLWVMQRYRAPVADKLDQTFLSWQSLPGTLFTLIRITARTVLDAHWSGGIIRVSPQVWLNSLVQGVATLAILGLIGYACYWLWSRTALSVWGIVLLPALVTLLVLMSKGAIPERYLMPYFLAIHIAVAYCLAQKLLTDPMRRGFWLSVTALVLIAGLCSVGVSAQTPVWSIKFPSSTAQNGAIAAAINQTETPCVIVYQPPDLRAFGKAGRDRLGRMLSLSHGLKPSVALELINDPQQVTFPAGYSDYFIYRPSSAVRETIQTDQGYQLLPVDGIAQDELLMVSTLPVAASTE